MINSKNAKAVAVLAYLYDMLPEHLASNIVHEPYCNGREHGFAVVHRATAAGRKVAFAEYRDDADILVLYRGGFTTFDPCNTPTVTVFDNTYTYCSSDLRDAAYEIVDYLGLNKTQGYDHSPEEEEDE